MRTAALRPTPRSGRLWPVAVVVVALVGQACASRWAPFDRSRRAYLACLDEHRADPEACDHLAEQADREYEEYERESQRHWGCENTPDDCASPPPGGR